MRKIAPGRMPSCAASRQCSPGTAASDAEEDARGERRVEEDVRDQDARQAVEPAAGVESEEPQPLPDPAGAAEHRDDAEDRDDRRQHAREIERRDEEIAAREILAADERQRERRAENKRERGRKRRLEQREADDASDVAPGKIGGLRSGREEKAGERGGDHAEDQRERREAGQQFHRGRARAPLPLVGRGSG